MGSVPNINSEPEEPDPSDCCGSGCNPCIFDVYKEQLRKWKMKQIQTYNSTTLDQCKFSPFVIKMIDNIASNIKIFEFQAVKLIGETKNQTLISNAKCDVDYNILMENLGLRAGHYLILKGEYEKSDKITGSTLDKISRPYTPILLPSKGEKGIFKIVVSLYPDGQMSQFFNKLNEKDVIFWRGPYTEFVYHTNSFKSIILFGAGTGIVPLYNIAKEVVENEIEETYVKVLATFRNIESFILRKELNKLQEYWNFKINCFITNQQNKDYLVYYNETILFSKLTKDIIFQELCNCLNQKTLILICGPKSFNSFVQETALEFGIHKENVFVFE